MTILVTGAAGFIGHATSRALLERGEQVLGIDNFNDSYDVQIKKDRIANIKESANFEFVKGDVSDQETLSKVDLEHGPFEKVIHLSAQAGVRASIERPFGFVRDNIIAHMNILELCRKTNNFQHLVFASSSSVYGGNTETKSATADKVDKPLSLYAATKAADELMSYSHSHLFGLCQTGLRFFTVYGPWGRPDMALYLFTNLIDQGKPITLFNQGNLFRDFTYIDDIVDGILRSLDRPPSATEDEPPFKVYNLGLGRAVPIRDLVTCIENELDKKATIQLAPKHLADPEGTLADLSDSERDLGYKPKTNVEKGVKEFVAWYKSYQAK